jgi:hypothetical protein
MFAVQHVSAIATAETRNALGIRLAGMAGGLLGLGFFTELDVLAVQRISNQGRSSMAYGATGTV